MPNSNRTSLEFDKYIDVLVAVINESKFMKRAEMKPMSTPKGDDETHLTSRAMHMRQAADIAKKLAKELELNENLAYGGMLMHDAGHPFNAHEGEEILKAIGKINYCGSFHHNAKGVDVILSENIIGKVLDRIPEAQKDKQLRDKLEQEFYYFLDVVVSHDGESTGKDGNKRIIYKDIKEAVLSKVSDANTKDKYKCQSETAEAQLAKIADVIAYLKSDILDSFELDIAKNISDEYLCQIGTILLETDEKQMSKEDKIIGTKKVIEEIKNKKYRELESDMENDNGKEIINQINLIIKKLQKNGIDTYCINPEQKEKISLIVSEEIEKIEEKKLSENRLDQSHISAESHKIIDCLQKKLKVRHSVVEEIMTNVQQKLCEDYISNSKGKSKEEMGFSKRIERAFYKIKTLDYSEFVQYTKREYQATILPPAVSNLVKQCAESLIKTGVIRDKFYDPSIRQMINNEEILKYIRVTDNSVEKEREYDKYKEKIGIDELKPIAKAKLLKRNTKYKNRISDKLESIIFRKNRVPVMAKKRGRNINSTYGESDRKWIKPLKNLNIKYPKTIRGIKKYKKVQRFTEKLLPKTMYKKRIFKGIYGFAQRQGSRFATSCEDVYNAIPYNVKTRVGNALKNTPPNDYLPEEDAQQNAEELRKICNYFENADVKRLSTSDLEEYINKRIEEERNNLEEKVACEIAIKYIGGTTDKSILEFIKNTGNVNKRKLKKMQKRTNEPSKSVTKVLAAVKAALDEDEDKKNNSKKVKKDDGQER